MTRKERIIERVGNVITVWLLLSCTFGFAIAWITKLLKPTQFAMDVIMTLIAFPIYVTFAAILVVVVIYLSRGIYRFIESKSDDKWLTVMYVGIYVLAGIVILILANFVVPLPSMGY